MKIACISDTHCKHNEIDGIIRNLNVDMLIHAGDGSNSKIPAINYHEAEDVLTWMDSFYDIQHKIYVPGNHDTSIWKGLIDIEKYDTKILIHCSIYIDGINIFGSPYTPTYGNDWAYNVKRNKLDIYWNQIPEYTDILITHGPPKSILDLTTELNGSLVQVGCKSLFNKVLEIQPKYHIFGHLHDESNIFNHGILNLGNKCKTTFVNAGILNLKNQVINKPIIIEI